MLELLKTILWVAIAIVAISIAPLLGWGIRILTIRLWRKYKLTDKTVNNKVNN